jgi:hypothetical protein
MSRRIIDILAGLVFLIIGIGMIYSTQGMKPIIPNDVGPAFLPNAIGACLIGLSVAKLVFALRSKEEKSVGGMQLVGKGLITILITGIYVMVFRNLGFIISSIIYLLVQIPFLKQDEKVSIKAIVAISIVSPIVIYYIFVNLLNLMLPAGVLG